MRLLGIVTAGALLLTVGHAVAQEKIAPSRQYGTSKSTLDKNYGLPTFGRPEAAMPRQRTMAPEPKTREDTGAGALSSLSSPALPSPPSTSSSDGDSSTGVPDFFSGTTDFTLPSSQRAKTAAASGMETPDSTTSDGSTMDSTTSDTTTGDTTSADGFSR